MPKLITDLRQTSRPIIDLRAPVEVGEASPHLLDLSQDQTGLSNEYDTFFEFIPMAAVAPMSYSQSSFTAGIKDQTTGWFESLNLYWPALIVAGLAAGLLSVVTIAQAATVPEQDTPNSGQVVTDPSQSGGSLPATGGYGNVLSNLQRILEAESTVEIETAAKPISGRSAASPNFAASVRTQTPTASSSPQLTSPSSSDSRAAAPYQPAPVLNSQPAATDASTPPQTSSVSEPVESTSPSLGGELKMVDQETSRVVDGITF